VTGEGKTRIMGLDIGEKTIGVAVSDELGITASGITTIRRKGWREDLKELSRFIEEYKVAEVVVGLPRRMDGTIGSKAEEMGRIIERLGRSLKVKVTPWDERLTTVEAERLLIASGVRREKRRKVIDKVAATIILEGYLEHLRARRVK
jgi:putative Holliday junction resolvase